VTHQPGPVDQRITPGPANACFGLVLPQVLTLQMQITGCFMLVISAIICCFGAPRIPAIFGPIALIRPIGKSQARFTGKTFAVAVAIISAIRIILLSKNPEEYPGKSRPITYYSRHLTEL
jgi:hypothetical protein